MLHRCATWMMRTQDIGSLSTAQRKPLLRVIGFQQKGRTGYKPLSYGEAVEKTSSEGIEMAIRKRQLESAGTRVRHGDSRLLKTNHVWVAGGAKAQARRLTGDVLRGLPPEKPEGLRGDPAQSQSMEMGRIRSYCQGWMRLDDCCEERGHVVPGNRERSINTR